MATDRSLLDQVRRVQAAQRKAAARVQDASWYEFLVSPTCPPSQALYIRGGLAYADKADFGQTWSGKAWTIPTLLRDLSDEAHIVSTTLSFSQPNYYQYHVVLLALPQDNLVEPALSDWKLRLRCWTLAGATYRGYPLEVATSGEAEAALLAFLYDGGVDIDDNAWPWGASAFAPTGMPLCGLILKNDGTVGNGPYFLPIDRVNRGRSYLWPKDLRPRWMET